MPVSPQRIVDSRFGVGAGITGPDRPGPERRRSTWPASGRYRPGATAAIVNVTSVDSSIQSFITVWPAGAAMPTASTLNPRVGVPVPNLAYLKLGAGGQLSLYNNSGFTDFIVDVFGYIVS